MIDQNAIRAYRNIAGRYADPTNLSDAISRGKQTAFLSHSHKDSDLAKSVQAFLVGNGWDVYIDWQDNSMPDRPNHVTANKIKDRIRQTGWFIYLATYNSSESRWCPWEIGYADGVKGSGRIVIMDTFDEQKNARYGAEYLEIYNRIDRSAMGRYYVFSPNNEFIPFGTFRG